MLLKSSFQVFAVRSKRQATEADLPLLQAVQPRLSSRVAGHEPENEKAPTLHSTCHGPEIHTQTISRTVSPCNHEKPKAS